MKYMITDRLQDFEFGDSEFTLVSWDNDHLTVSVEFLNIHKDAVPGNSDSDMEIEKALITFYGFQLHEFEPGRTWKRNETGRDYTDDPLIVYTDGKACAMLENELSGSITVWHLEEDSGGYELDASGIDPFFSVRFSFSSVEVTWDAYRKKAWYELHRQYKKQLTLATPGGDIKTEALIICHDEDVYTNGDEKIEGPSVSVGVKYNGQTVWGDGKDYLWEDAFAGLQKKLPDGVEIKCCLTCRHGNLCPVGNTPGEVFCTKDVSITQKSDLFFYTEDREQREKRARDYTDLCESYREQSDEYFTYNQYLCYLTSTRGPLSE